MKISPRILPGPLIPENRCVDWGWQGLLAYGSQAVVVIVEPKTVQVYQTLDHHKHTVTKVKWCYENYHHSLASPYGLRLASSDSAGKIIVWDVSESSVRAEFSENSKPVLDMEWLRNQDSSRDLLAVLHPSSTLALWNADTGAKVWKKNLAETLVSFSIDPFDKKRLAVLSQDCLLFVDEFSSARVPSAAPSKFYIASSSSAPVGARPRSAMKRVRQLVGDSKKSDEPTSFSDCLQMCYSPACRHHLFLVYPREILLLDLQVHQTVGVIYLERNCSPFQQIIACRQRDILYCLHENGCISVRIRRKYQLNDISNSTQVTSLLSSQNLDIVYDLRCQSDALRLSKHSKVVRVCVDPIDERTAALVLSDGRVLFWQLLAFERLMPVSALSLSDPSLVPPLSPPSHSVRVKDGGILSDAVVQSKSLGDLFGPQSFPWVSTLQQSGGSFAGVTLKLVLNGLLQAVAAPPLCLRMCPPLTTKNFAIYEPLLAAGTASGTVQVFNVESAHLHREFIVHTSPVRGMDWLDMHRLLSFSYPTLMSGGVLVKNELRMVHIKSGICTTVRLSKEEEPTMESVKVSFSRNYFAVLIKDRPLELWDCTHLSLLRELSGDFPTPVVMEWSPMHLPKNLAKLGRASATFSTKEIKVLGKEHFVITDISNTLLHYTVEGSTVKEVVKIVLEGMNQITNMAWKGDMLVIGDVDGQVSFWDLKKKISKNVMIHRNTVKKIRFAPGKGNALMGVLYSNGHLDIMTSHTSDVVGSLKTLRANDFEFSASDKPTIASTTGCIRLMDFRLQNATCPVSVTVPMEPVFCPRALLGKAGLLLKSLLQHQPWRDSYSLDEDVLPAAGDPDEYPIETAAIAHFKVIPQSMKSSLSNTSLGVAYRCLMTARLYGDEYEVSFWEVALYYLIRERERFKDPNYKSVLDAEPVNPTSDIFSPHCDAVTSVGSQEDLLGVLASPTSTTSGTELKALASNGSFPMARQSSVAVEAEFILDACHDLLVDSADFQRLQLYRVALHDSKRSTYDHTQKCAAELIYLKQTDRVVQLLLETEPDNDQYYSDALRACLVATIRSSGASQSTIKLVATNLIANGRLSEGVQLLCLIDKGLDACRYLQSYEEWELAAWLAKATLSERDCAEVFMRWADHLLSPSVNRKSQAVLIYLTFGLFHKALETLYSMRQFDLAAMFAEACLEFNMLDKSSDLNSLVEAIFLEYARYLHAIGNKQGAVYYCSKAGENGSQLLRNEIQINTQDPDVNIERLNDGSQDVDDSSASAVNV